MFNADYYKYFFLAYFIFFVILCFAWPLYRMWTRHKVFAITFKGSDSAHDYIGRVFKLLIALAGIPIIFLFFRADLFAYLIPITLPSFFFPLGLVIMLISIVWISTAQIQMDQSWRIGIDYEKKTALVRRGLFKYSRNPIYLGVHGSLLGIFFVIPNAVSFIALALAHIIMQIQTRLEEEHLKNLHGNDFLDFKKNVRRWI